jgi:transposase
MTRLKIQTLRGAGVLIDEVAELAGVSPRSVQRVAKEPPIEDVAAVDNAASQRMGRPSKVQAHESQVQAWLAAEPTLPTNHVLERLRGEGYVGSKTAVYDLVRELRGRAPQRSVSRFEGLPGEFSQHDFGEVWVRYRDGRRERVKFFASVLKFSRMRRAMLVPDETTESVCHGLVDACRYFEGVPLLAVFDNPKTIVTQRDGDRVKWNPTFSRFCVEAGIVPHATWPRRPQEKGAVENAVGFVKGSFFKAHVFEDRADLEKQLEAWHRRINDERPSRATGEVPRTRHLLERPRLRPLGTPPGGFRLRYTRIVRTDCFVELEGVRYYVAERFIGAEATLHVDRDQVQVWVAGDLVATHPRRPVGSKRSVLPSQREELINKPGARPYLKRELLLGLCPAAMWFLTELRHRRPKRWEDEVARLYELLGEFEEVAVRDAFVEVARRELVGAEYVEAILRGQAAKTSPEVQA